MATVPRYDDFQVGLTAGPSARLAVPSTPGADALGAEQMQRQGMALQQAGGRMAELQRQAIEEANQVRTNAALNQLKEEQLRLTYDKSVGFTSLKGSDALQRPDGKGLDEEYGEQFQRKMNDIAATLGNSAQRQAFMQNASGMLTSLRGQAMQHAVGEFKTYTLSQSEGIQATAARDIALNYRDPEKVNNAVQRMRAETYQQAKLLGKSAEWQEAASRKLISAAHGRALAAALQDNQPAYAEKYFARYRDQMEPDDILAAQGHITKDVDTRQAVAAADRALAANPMQASGWDRVKAITVQSESGGDPNAVSPVGARGRMQVMPDTAKNPGHGIKPSNGTPDDDERVGDELLQWGIKNYGDLGKAWAAYNAGEKWVNEAIDRAGKAAPGTQQADWFWQLNNDGRSAANRQQTQAYVEKNLRAYNAGQAPRRPTLAELDAGLQADPAIANNPERLKQARAEVQRRYLLETSAIKQRDEDNTAAALRGLYENGGHFSALPAQVRMNIPPSKLTEVMNAAERIAKGDDTTNGAMYLKLTDETYLRSLSDAQFFALRTELSQSDWQQFAKQRAKGDASSDPGSLNTEAINSVVGNRLRQLGLDTSTSDGNKDSPRVSAVQQFVRQSIANAQMQAGKKFNDVEVEQHIDRLFATSAKMRDATFLLPESWEGTTSTRMLSMKASDIPADVRRGIKADFKARGIGDPTEADVLGVYWRLQSAQQGR